MNTADYVDNKIKELLVIVKESGMPISEAAFEGAKLCVGWPYVYGSWGAYCTPSERKKRQGYHPEKTEITKKCQVLNGSKSGCSGCKWYPNGNRTRCYDCRGFTDWILDRFGIEDLYGDSVGVQWKTDKNWKAKGTIDTIPDDILVCLFVYKNGNWQHTGLGYKGHTCECSSGVQYFEKRDKKWTHWAIPKGIDGEVPTPTPGKLPTLRRGDKGEWVTKAQALLLQKGYDLGKCGVDGSFGVATEKAVRQFQQDHLDADGKPLVVDGVIGQKTWDALLDQESTSLYTVTIPHLPKYKAEALIKSYSGAYMVEEKG